MMTLLKKLRRWLLLFVAIFLLVTGGLVVLMPWWFPHAARPLARAYGIEWQETGRQGWSAYSLNHVLFSSEGVDITLDRLVIPQPIPWVAARLGLTQRGIAHGGNLRIHLKESASSGGEPVGVEILSAVQHGIDDWLVWLPNCSLERLEIVRPDHTTAFRIDDLAMDGPIFTGHIPDTGRIPSVRFQLHLENAETIRLEASPTTIPDLRLEATLNPALPVPVLTASLLSGGVPLNAGARFTQGSWIPYSFSLDTVGWPVPGLIIPTRHLNPEGLVADLQAVHDAGSYTLDIGMRGRGTIPGYAETAFTVEATAEGDRTVVGIESFSIRTDWLTAGLSEPLKYAISEKAFLESTRLTVEADLSRKTGSPATGTLSGEVILQPGLPWRSDIQYSLIGHDLSIGELAIHAFRTMGNYRLDDQSFNSIGSFTLGTGIPGLPEEQIALQSPLSGTFTVSGDPDGWRHTGSLHPVRLKTRGFKPFTIKADWQGEGTSQFAVQSFIRTDAEAEANLNLTVHAGESPRTYRIGLREAAINDGHQTTFTLADPVTMTIDPSQPVPLQQVSPFRFVSGESSIHGRYDGPGKTISLEATDFELDSLTAWLEEAVPPLVIDAASATVSTMRPQLEADVDLRMHAPGEQLGKAVLEVHAGIGESGIHLDRLEGTVSGEPLLSGQLLIPLRLHPLGGPDDPFHSAIPGKGLEGSIQADIQPQLAGQLSEFPQLKKLVGLHLDLQVDGTLDVPKAQLQAYLPTLGILAGLDEKFADYPLRDVRLEASLSSRILAVDTLQARIGNGRISMGGEVPAPSLIRFLSTEPPDRSTLLSEMALSLVLEDFHAADFTTLLPPYLRPTGSLSGEITVQPGLDISGNLIASNFSLRPTLYSRTVDGINLSIGVDDQRMTITQATATIGNSPVELGGYLDFGTPATPVYHLTLSGQRTPLLRTPDLLLHGDIDLQLDRTDPDAPAQLKGDLVLRDGILLLDIDPLAARTTGTGIPDPPFFSVRQEPFSDWRLDIRISGDDCLRFRSPYVRTLLSTQMDLTGTLSHPVWVGNIFAEEGTIDFPGLRTEMSRSEIFVTREQQDSLQLDISSTGQVASHVLTMDVSGSLSDPHVEFASTPDLPNAQILQLLATGSIDGVGFGSVGLYLGRGFFATGAGGSVWDRFSVEVGRDVTEASKNTIDLYFDLTDRWRLHGEYDKYDAQNLNIEWEVFSR